MTDRPVILLHGWTMQGAVFDALRAGLGHRALAPDLPGHGANRAGPVGLGACVAQLRALIAATGRADALVVGWSMGAMIAWAYIEAYGCDEIGGLVTLDMSPRPVNGADWALGLQGQTPDRLAKSTAEIHADWPNAAEKIATTMFAHRSGAPGLSREAALEIICANDRATMALYWDEMMARDLRHVAATISVPWLVGHGGQSRVYPAGVATWLGDQTAMARVQCFRRSGHSPHLEEPAAFLHSLKTFESSLPIDR